MAKTLLFTATAATVTPGSGGNTFDITNPSAFMSITLEASELNDGLTLVKADYAGTSWLPFFDCSGDVIKLDKDRPTVTIAEIGTYAFTGSVRGTVTVYTEA